jgi:hypothetical protein
VIVESSFDRRGCGRRSGAFHQLTVALGHLRIPARYHVDCDGEGRSQCVSEYVSE